MTQDQIILFALFVIVFALMLWGRFRYDLVAFAALLTGLVLGVVPQELAFSGFGHPATVIVALVLVVSSGLVRSGAVQVITRTMVDKSRALSRHIIVMGGIGAVLSAFMNNVAALALLMPVDVQTARKAKRAAGLSLMPLSFATILGGMVTLIGTPPNIIIASFREERFGTAFAMFDFAPVGALVAAAGLAFVAAVGWRLIPLREDAVIEAADLEDYIAELIVPEESEQIGKRLHELDEAAEAADVAILGLVRDGRRLYGTAKTTPLKPGDALVLEARPDALDEFRSTLSLAIADAEGDHSLSAETDGLDIVEVVVPHDARIVGKSAQSVGLHWRHRTVLMGISRQGRKITQQVRKTPIAPGDILLLLVPKDQGSNVTEWLGGLTLANRGLAVTQNRKSGVAVGLFAAAVAAASFGLLSLPVALGLVSVGYVLTRIIPLSEVYGAIEWPVVVLLGSMIPLGAALDAAGGTQLIAGALTGATQALPVWGVLALLMVVTMTLSDVLNNTATAIVAAPVAVDMADRLQVSPDPFLMAVAVAASAAFLTPIGHKNNTLILGPGGFRFGDYWRMGLPLEVLVIAVAVPAILRFWPL